MRLAKSVCVESSSFQLLELGVLFVPIVGVEEVDGLVVVAAGTGVEGG